MQDERFKISLAEWSLHRSIERGRLSTLQFPETAKREFGIEAVELVNTLMDSPRRDYLRKLRATAEDWDVTILLIMCDDEGDLSAANADERRRAARNHFKWLDAARELDCRAVRVNSGGESPVNQDTVKRCAESCRAILDYAEPLGLEVLVENHWGLSADVDLLLLLVDQVNHAQFGLLPDFGNFDPGVDRYRAVERLMPFAKAVSAKCFSFDKETGEESTIDFKRMLDIVRQAGYRGYLGIEYEGDMEDEFEGIRRAKRLIERWGSPAP